MEHQLSKVEGVRCGKVQKEQHKITTAMREYQRQRVELFEGEFIL
jgi:Zn ribbon nucleic-acid-binding protein